MSSSRDFVESYVKDISQDTEAYLAQQQPNYDAAKTASIATPPPTQATKPDQQKEEIQPTSQFSFHKATTNPMASENDSIPQQQQQQQQQEPKVVWTVRDFTDQRQEIHDTALVNCSDLHIDLMQCFQHGSWWDKAKMCEDQKQRFWKCFHSQKNFLKAANYKGPISTPEEDDTVLMQAIKLRDQQDAADTTKEDPNKHTESS
ncbi:uncharacterized protein BX664DRAFT_326161 [Halteromyces radiatus]|uniref:uncharacterized protein n=1 Tax=Halteromyces radiatus TaxID=101107 RepID=UPI0022210DB1|nr:uncharacterized protein BX664DRAFT_326161 [Halteromyces radiatus]KAI8097341.1 hypothetical protein BX664DRAFT_326161 [Halteromyces radiatus]